MAVQRANIAAVAKAAGVARSTVSRVLNGGYASAETKRRVERAIAKLDYSPSAAARNFATGRAGAIGVVLEDVRGEWLIDLLSGVEAELHAQHSALVLGSLGSGAAYDASVVNRWIDHRRVDGIIFIRPGEKERPLLEAVEAEGLPTCLVAPDVQADFAPVVASHNRDAGREVGRHLCALGHRHVAFVGGPEASIDSVERLGGLEEALAEVALMIDQARFCDAYHVDRGRAYASDWLRSERRPTAIVFGNDAMALGFMNVVLSQGIHIPDQVSVVGFDDIPASRLVWPRLTTVRQESAQLGAAAIRSVFEQLDPPEASDEDNVEDDAMEDAETSVPPTHTFPMALVVRESTGRPNEN